MSSDATLLTDSIKAAALKAGFDLVGVAPAAQPETLELFERWRKQGFAGEMGYIERRSEAYAHPRSILDGVRSVVMVGLIYRATTSHAVTAPGEGRVACYAWGTADYHDLMRDRLRSVADALHERAPGCRTRIVVDTAPLLERDFARRAGLGWFGKNTMLINKQNGSWFFLGGVLTDAALQPDAPHAASHCGTCTRCLDACPTSAFTAPWVLDARKCISYLTIELGKQPIPEELRGGIGEWLFGCDVCQDVCPWNRKAPHSAEPAFQPRRDLNPADCVALLQLSPDEFALRFGRTPLTRAGRAGLLRNACIVLANTGDGRAIPALRRAVGDNDPLVRETATWALQRLQARGVLESEPAVPHHPS